MATMREIKRRKASIQSTEQITNAMKLVSTVKLQKSRGRAEKTRPYSNLMYHTVQHILAQSGGLDHPFLKTGSGDKAGVIVITSNRGLAGGYNSNIVRLITGSGLAPEKTLLYAVGRKGKEGLGHRGYAVEQDFSNVMDNPGYEDAMIIGKQLMSDFNTGKIGEIWLAYTSFRNTVSHEPKLMKLLPLDPENFKELGQVDAPMCYDPDEEEVLDALIPMYIKSLIYGALVESLASENGARMQAMDSATSNAEEMIDKLSLQYNRARQASITQELTEIIAGANAIDG